ncbi:unnamed protein product [Polarella glacialis]|uniref:RING-type domain-containing protein n=1 Tax=Polarella glacialis TaxID=89957 RepID=A0A813KTG4_POLGL|nr:unnamed protein product [Polarella glacialis]
MGWPWALMAFVCQSFHLRATCEVCPRTLCVFGEVRIGVASPRTSLLPFSTRNLASCIWSKPQEYRGQLFDVQVPGAAGSELCRLRIDDGADAELALRLAEPGEAVPFGSEAFRNALGLPLLAVHGRIAGKSATGLFDPATSVNLAAEMEASGAGEAARLAVECGADPRALADDGISPYTAAILAEDPCDLLAGLHPGLRQRILRGDHRAWAEVARSSVGAGHPDIAARALSQGLPIPDEMVEALLEHCFESEPGLPLLAARVLARVDGQRYLITALDRATDRLSWLRAAERILEQSRPGQNPPWLQPDTLGYCITQIRKGRHQFRLLLEALLRHFRSLEAEDFYRAPCILPADGGAECPICFEPLSRGVPVAFLNDQGCAICPHFLCANCSRGYASSATSQGEAIRCPECRRNARAVGPVPAFTEDPLRWFDFLAAPTLSAASAEGMARSMLLRAISALIPVDADALEASIEEGDICMSLGQEVSACEFIENGLYAWVWQHVQEHLRCLRLGAPPDLADRQDWFRYWNLSKSDRLTRSEALRALLRTFRVASLDKQRLAYVRQKLDMIWDLCTEEQHRRLGCHDPAGICCREFSAPGGVGDLIEEAFSFEPGCQGLHPQQESEALAAAAASKVISGRHRLRGRPGCGVRQARGLQASPAIPRTAADATPEAPPDLMVPQERPMASASALARLPALAIPAILDVLNARPPAASTAQQRHALEENLPMNLESLAASSFHSWHSDAGSSADSMASYSSDHCISPASDRQSRPGVGCASPVPPANDSGRNVISL